MARYVDYNYDQMKMIRVSYEKQILPGSFEYSLSWLIDEEFDLTAFRGITSSRRIEALCRENIIFLQHHNRQSRIIDIKIRALFEKGLFRQARQVFQ